MGEEAQSVCERLRAKEKNEDLLAEIFEEKNKAVLGQNFETAACLRDLEREVQQAIRLRKADSLLEGWRGREASQELLSEMRTAINDLARYGRAQDAAKLQQALFDVGSRLNTQR